VFSSPYGVPPGSRRTLRRHGAQRQTALRGLQETIGDVNLHRHTKTTKAEASNGLGFRFWVVPNFSQSTLCIMLVHLEQKNSREPFCPYKLMSSMDALQCR